jgi:hypothetical protein
MYYLINLLNKCKLTFRGLQSNYNCTQETQHTELIQRENNIYQADLSHTLKKELFAQV